MNRFTPRHLSKMVEGIKVAQLIDPLDIGMEVVTQDPVGKVLGALISTIK